MLNVRCHCGKIVCQLENVPGVPAVRNEAQDRPGPGIVILCRHCKSYVVLRVPEIASVHSRPASLSTAPQENVYVGPGV